jgi:hypothetical protein
MTGTENAEPSVDSMAHAHRQTHPTYGSLAPTHVLVIFCLTNNQVVSKTIGSNVNIADIQLNDLTSPQVRQQAEGDHALGPLKPQVGPSRHGWQRTDGNERVHWQRDFGFSTASHKLVWFMRSGASATEPNPGTSEFGRRACRPHLPGPCPKVASAKVARSRSGVLCARSAPRRDTMPAWLVASFCTTCKF